MTHILAVHSTRVCDVYFIEAPCADLVKIGITGDLEKRIRDLRNGSPVGLRLLLSVRGGARHEWLLKRTFAAERRHGEWFVLSERIRQFIVGLVALDNEQAVAKLDGLLDDLSLSEREQRFYGRVPKAERAS